MIKNLYVLAAGLLFGSGLTLGGMSNPDKVLDFLDITGTWDPSLALVMGGAIALAVPGMMYARNAHKPLWGNSFQLPSSMVIDRKLVGGALLFGIGWGLAGICPGPGFTLVILSPETAIWFMPALLAGIWTGGKIS